MQIEMTKSVRGSPHGHDVFSYERGRVYSPETDPVMTPSLAAAFLGYGWAKKLEAEQNKMVVAPENKRRRGRPPKQRAQEIEV